MKKSVVCVVHNDSLPDEIDDIYNWGKDSTKKDLTSLKKIQKMIEKSIELTVGDLEKKLKDLASKKNKTVDAPLKIVIKPNLTVNAPPDRVATTDPRVVQALCSYLIRISPEGSKIILAENSAFGPRSMTRKAFETTRVGPAAKAAGINGKNIIPLSADNPLNLEPRILENSLLLDRVHIFKEIFTADYLINLPKMKVLVDYLVSLGLKNWQGIVPYAHYRDIDGYESTIGNQPLLGQQGCHRADMDMKIVDIHLARKPDLTIIDGIFGMEGQGPWSGDPLPMKLLIASNDVVAADTIACICMGIEPYEVGAIRNAYMAGLTEMNYDLNNPLTSIELKLFEFDRDSDPNGLIPESIVKEVLYNKIVHHFRRPCYNPTGLIENVHVHVGGTCIGCLANIRGALDNLLKLEQEGEFSFKDIGEIHIISGLDVLLPKKLNGKIFVVGDCSFIRPHDNEKNLIEEIIYWCDNKNNLNIDSLKEYLNSKKAESNYKLKSTYENIKERYNGNEKDIIKYRGCAPATIFDRLPMILKEMYLNN